MTNRTAGSDSTGLRELFRAQTADRKDDPAYVFLGHDLEPAEVLSYSSLRESAEAFALHLRACTRPGDRVVLAFNNDPDAVRLFWGCLLAGLVPVPTPAPEAARTGRGHGGSRLLGIARDAGVALAFTQAEHLDAARAQAPDVIWHTAQTLLAQPPAAAAPPFPPDFAEGTNADLAYLQYTSGSTSAPRGVEITHAAVLGQCRALMHCLRTDAPRGLVWLPWFHDYGLVHGVIQSMYLGCTSYLMPTAHFALRPLRWLEAIYKYGITHSGAPDFAYAACVQALSRASGWSARLDSLQLATCGAEPVRAATLKAFADAFAPFGLNRAALAPSYGLAEAVLAVTVHDPAQPVLVGTFDASSLEQFDVTQVAPGTTGTRTLVGCGTALPGFEVRIVDPDTAIPSAPDRIGEIWINGDSVGRGYWGQPAATGEVFGATLAGEGAQAARYLRTGDLGFMHGGELFIAGRRKDLIIVNGRNLYPQDLERSAEAVHPSVRTGGVIAVSVDRGGKEVVALLVEYVGRRTPEVIAQLVDQIRGRVATEHQVDLHDILALRAGTLPRTSSGKPQRGAARRLYLQGALEPLRLATQALPEPAPASGTEHDAALDDSLTLLWSQVLGVESIGPDANFFDLGGDSLLATQLVSRLRTRLGIELPISALFEGPTLRQFAQRVRQAPAAAAAPPPEALVSEQTDRAPGQRVPLSFSQERMWFMHELAPDSSAYNIPLALRMRGPLDVAAMQAALNRVIERHEVLRTRFLKTTDGVTGEVTETPRLSIQEIHPGDAGSPVTEAALHHHLATVSGMPFRLDRDALIRAQVVHLAKDDAVLLVVMHHIVGDQWSFSELGRELAEHYNAIKAGTQAALPAMPFQYADYARWHSDAFAGERHAREQAYWLQRLHGLEPLALNEDFSRPRTQSFRGAAVRLPLAPDHIAALRQLGAAHGASLSMVLIAALKVLLRRHTGKTDIAIGVPIANRHHLASENLIGTFVNTLVYRTDLGGDPDFVAVLERVRQTSLEAFEHQDMPFELLVRAVNERTAPGRPPLFNVMFNMVSSQARDSHFDKLTWQRMDFDRQSTQFDLTVVADLLHDQAITIEYATDLFARETVERMAEHLRRILQAVVASPQARVATLPLIGTAEAARLRTWSQGPAEATTGQTLAEWTARGAARTPQQIALVTGAKQLTHQQLDQASNRLARLLRERGVGRGQRVGLCLPRGQGLLVSLLAILKAGAAYVPLDPDHPAQRLTHQIDDAGLSLLVTDQASAQGLAHGALPCLLLDSDSALIAATPDTPLAADADRDAGPDDPAYVIYTSGSTGQPKGVVVPHRAVVNFLSSMAREPGLTAQDRLLAVTTPSFDIAVLELLLPLGVGATVVMASASQAGDGSQLADLIAREQITVLQATPSRWHLLLEAGWTGKAGLKALVGGEPLTPHLAELLLPRCGEVWNMYGPTETTVWSSLWRVSQPALPAISLGRPVANTTVQILDAHLQPCPIGVPGEICIGGTGLATGYHQRPALTAERFIELPGADATDTRRIYRTGDLGRWRHDGSLEHLGRLDEQVKLRGFRVEPGEIEAQLMRHPGVARAVVALREDQPGNPRLVAYLVPGASMPTRVELVQHLRQWLPDHMVPAAFVEIADVPVLANGKTNRRALPAPADAGDPGGALPTPPRNAIEQTIWAAWSEVLDTRSFGIHDNFFDLGGHSILAVRVVSRIEDTLGQPCPLRTLFEHPTVARLADALAQRQAGDGVPDVPVAVLQPQGEAPGLFLLAGAEMYRPLAQRLDAQRPVYGVFSQTEIDLLDMPADATTPALRVETLAREYLALIRSIQPHGPYFLGGFSIGGVLAYEVAQCLLRDGEAIGQLILLDTMLPGRGARHLWAGVRRRWRMLRRDGLKHLLHIYSVYRRQTEHHHEPGSRRIRLYAETIRKYQAVPSDLPVLFLQAGDDASTAPAYGWRTLVPGLRMARVPGRHMDILDPPNVETLAAHVRDQLAAVPAHPPSKGDTPA
jgi:amino acid adenylation domain-containing protein